MILSLSACIGIVLGFPPSLPSPSLHRTLKVARITIVNFDGSDQEQEYRIYQGRGRNPPKVVRSYWKSNAAKWHRQCPKKTRNVHLTHRMASASRHPTGQTQNILAYSSLPSIMERHLWLDGPEWERDRSSPRVLDGGNIFPSPLVLYAFHSSIKTTCIAVGPSIEPPYQGSLLKINLN